METPILFLFSLFAPSLIALLFPEKYRPILNSLGLMTAFMGVAMLIPMTLDFLDFWESDDQWITNSKAFGLSAMITIFNGSIVVLSTQHSKPLYVGPKHVFVLTGLSWFVFSLSASLPFILSNATMTLTDSFFEAISATTTTGATVLTGINFASPGIVLWRSLLQWFGGIGIIVMGMTILPEMKIGGMQLFHSEFSDRSDKILPKVSSIAKRIVFFYFCCTVLCFLCLFLMTDMTCLDAICHAMTIMATGGFSTVDYSIGAFNSLCVEIIAMVFMCISGTSLMLYMRFASGNLRVFFKDEQFRFYMILIFLTISALTLWRFFVDDVSFSQALRECSFTAISIITTSGFTNTDFSLWAGFPIVLIFGLMLLGGCSGSTSGGLKIFRFQVMWRIMLAQMKAMMSPHGVFVPKLNNKLIENSVLQAVFTFLTLYLFTGFLLTLGLSLFQLDFLTSLSGAFSSLSNVGPGLGEIIGPSGHYQGLPQGAKWLLIGGMLLGRLELITVFIFCSPAFWRR